MRTLGILRDLKIYKKNQEIIINSLKLVPSYLYLFVIQAKDTRDIFTESALWADSVIEGPCPSVGLRFFPRLFKRTAFDQPTVDSVGVSRGRSVGVAVGCWLFALQRHFDGTSTALPWPFHSTSMAQKIICWYSFFYQHWSKYSVSPVSGILDSVS